MRQRLTVCQNVPDDQESGSDPCGVVLNLEFGDREKNVGPVLTRQELVHSQERIEEGGESNPNVFAVVILRQLPAKHLRCKKGSEECQKEHEQDQVQETSDVAQDGHLQQWLAQSYQTYKPDTHDKLPGQLDC